MKKVLIAVMFVYALTYGVFAQTQTTAREYPDRGDRYYNNGDFDRAIADYTETTIIINKTTPANVDWVLEL